MKNDQCRYCTCKGNLKECLETECQYHDNWYTEEVKTLHLLKKKIMTVRYMHSMNFKTYCFKCVIPTKRRSNMTVLNKQEVLDRLCELCKYVADSLNHWDQPNDCFCKNHVGPKMDERTIEFIEDTIFKTLNKKMNEEVEQNDKT